MTKAGEQLLEGAREALAVARGEQPAARMHINGHTYVPEAELLAVKAALAVSEQQVARLENQLMDERVNLGLSP